MVGPAGGWGEPRWTEDKCWHDAVSNYTVRSMTQTIQQSGGSGTGSSTPSRSALVTGIELIEKLRRNEETKHIPAVLLTARSFAITQEMQESLGIEECLSKPFSPKELLKTIQDILYQRAVAVRG